MDGLYDQFRVALHQIWRRRWIALGTMWALCLLGWLGVALIPNSYESRARVYAQMQSILPQQMGITAAERQNDLQRVRQTLTSTANLEKVVRRTDLNLLVSSDRDLAKQVQELRENILVTAQQDNLFEITASTGVAGFSNAQNARTASAIVQNLLDLFVEENLAEDRAETGQTLTFLDEELKRREEQLQEAEQRRMEFDTRFLGMLPGEGSLAQRMAAARMELSNIDQQLMSAQSSLAAIRGQLGGIAPSLPGTGGGGSGGYASQQLGTLEAQLSQARAKGWTDRHPDVVSARAQIERLRPQAQAERRSRRSGDDAGGVPNPAYTSLRAMAAEKEAQAAAASARKAQLQAAMAQLADMQNSAPGIVAEQARLNRDYEVLKRQYDKLLEDREQVRLRSDVQSKTDAIQFRIIDPPSKPIVPIAPNRPLLLTLIFFVALIGGLAAAFAKGRIQTTFPTQHRLEQVTGLPVLGTVGEVYTAERKLAERKRLKVFAGAGGALAAAYAILMLVEFWQRSTVA
jgi:polysaccharide chain length determinant protein (PEP-CTERM system associated)